MIYNGGLISGIQQSDSVIRLHISIFFQILSHISYSKYLEFSIRTNCKSCALNLFILDLDHLLLDTMSSRFSFYMNLTVRPFRNTSSSRPFRTTPSSRDFLPSSSHINFAVYIYLISYHIVSLLW